jgi:hypothetical protein
MELEKKLIDLNHSFADLGEQKEKEKIKYEKKIRELEEEIKILKSESGD